MSDKELIESLKKLVVTNVVLNDVLLVFSMRERARNCLSLAALHDRMVTEKFQHTSADLAKVLDILAKHRVGTLDVDAKGKIRGLKQIKISIPTLGKAVIGEGGLKGYKTRNRFYVPQAPAKQEAPEPKSAPVEQVASLILTFVNPKTGRAWNLPVPKGTTPDEVAEMLDRLQLPELSK